MENTHENFLEGDERIYTDGGRSPLIIGGATETYFNGSWYFCERAFACPVHGAPTFRMKGRMKSRPALPVSLERARKSGARPDRQGRPGAFLISVHRSKWMVIRWLRGSTPPTIHGKFSRRMP